MGAASAAASARIGSKVRARRAEVVVMGEVIP